MIFGSWKVRSLRSSGPLKKLARVLTRYRLDLVELQEVGCENGGTETVDCTVSCGKAHENHQLGNDPFSVNKRII